MTAHPHPESKGGTFSISRGIWNSDHFDDEPKTQREAFMWMISKARWKDGYQRVDGKMIFMKRGQLAEPIRTMADEWIWSKSRVLRFIQRLKIEAVIGTNTGTKTKVITLCKYNEYQLEPSERGTTSGTTSGTKLGQSWDKVARNPLTPNGNSAPNKGNKVNNKDSSVRGMEYLTAREDTHTHSAHEFEIDDPGSEDVRSAGETQTEAGKVQPAVTQGPDPGPSRRRTRDDRSDVAEDEKPFRLPRGFKLSERALAYAYGLGASVEEASRTAHNFTEHYTVGPGKKRERTKTGWSNCWKDWCDGDARNKGWGRSNRDKPSTNEAFSGTAFRVDNVLAQRAVRKAGEGVALDQPHEGRCREQGGHSRCDDVGTRQIPSAPRDETRGDDPRGFRFLPKVEAVCG